MQRKTQTASLETVKAAVDEELKRLQHENPAQRGQLRLLPCCLVWPGAQPRSTSETSCMFHTHSAHPHSASCRSFSFSATASELCCVPVFVRRVYRCYSELMNMWFCHIQNPQLVLWLKCVLTVHGSFMFQQSEGVWAWKSYWSPGIKKELGLSWQPVTGRGQILSTWRRWWSWPSQELCCSLLLLLWQQTSLLSAFC